MLAARVAKERFNSKRQEFIERVAHPYSASASGKELTLVAAREVQRQRGDHVNRHQVSKELDPQLGNDGVRKQDSVYPEREAFGQCVCSAEGRSSRITDLQGVGTKGGRDGETAKVILRD